MAKVGNDEDFKKVHQTDLFFEVMRFADPFTQPNKNKKIPQDVELNLSGIPNKDNNWVLCWATFGQKDPADATVANVQWYEYFDELITTTETNPKGCNSQVGEMRQVSDISNNHQVYIFKLYWNRWILQRERQFF